MATTKSQKKISFDANEYVNTAISLCSVYPKGGGETHDYFLSRKRSGSRTPT